MMHLLLLLLLVTAAAGMPLTIRTCTELQPLYLLNHVIPNRYNLPRGVSIKYDEESSVHAYQFSEHAGNLKFPAKDIFTYCTYFPEEYSILATFKLLPDAPRWDDGYLFALISEERVDLKLALSISMDRVTIHYSDHKIQPGLKQINFKESLMDNDWHTIIVTIAGNVAALRVDCGKTKSKYFERSFPAFLDTSGDNIHVGNRKIQPGQFRGLIKQLLVLPGADAGLLSCPSPVPNIPDISLQHASVQMEADGPYQKVAYQLPYDAVCTWKDTGKIWFDIYTEQLKVCHSGAWRITTHQTEAIISPAAVSSTVKLDYFTDYQKVPMPAPSIDAHVFTIADEGTFVVMANYRNGGPRKQYSVLYKWEKKSLQPYQNLTAAEPSSWSSFTIGRHTYLAVANMAATSKRTSTVVTVFRWSRRKKKFQPFQNLASTMPRDVEYMEIDEEHYLAVANHYSEVSSTGEKNYHTNSFIWKWNKKNKEFVEYQKIPTIGAWDFTYLTMKSSGVEYHFLIVANTIDGSTVKLDSKLYYWHTQNGQGAFQYYQSFETFGATDWEYFVIDGQSYLAVANSVNSLAHNLSSEEQYRTQSVIYKADPYQKRMEVFQVILTNGIVDWEYFTVGNDSYLISSNQQAGISTELNISGNMDTVIYRWQGSEKFVPAHKLQTAPSADWEALYDGHDTYLIYANGVGITTELFKAKLR